MRETAEEMFEWVKEEKKKLVWCCVDETFAKVLAEGVNGVEWSTLSCIQEDGLRTLPLSLSLPSFPTSANHEPRSQTPISFL